MFQKKIRRQAPAIHWDGPCSTSWKIASARGSKCPAPKKIAQPEADLEFRLFCARLSEFVNRISAATQCRAMRDVNGGLPRCLKMSEPRRHPPREARCCRSDPNGAAP